ncbi:MAG: transposase [Candidatus Omnitrophota bacterium]
MENGWAEKALNRFYRKLGKKRCRQIEAVAMDMWPAFMKATKKHCPQARLVFDKFHILSRMAQVVDQVRRREFKRASMKTREVIKGSRYLLLRNRAKVRGKKRIRLSELLALNKPINAVHVSNKDLKPLWDYRSPQWAETYFRDWYRRAIYSKIEPLKKFARMLRKHWEGIAANFLYPIHSSLLKAINNKAKVIKRIALG